MPDNYRFPLTQGKTLLGYWYLREVPGGFKLTTKSPHWPHVALDGDDPQAVVDAFTRSFYNYLESEFARLDNALAKLPRREYPKPGFRPGWLRKLRSKLTAQRSRLVRDARKDVGRVLRGLKAKGWPCSKLPVPPWGYIDVEKASSYARASAEVYGALSAGAVDPVNLTPVWRVRPMCSSSAGRRWVYDPHLQPDAQAYTGAAIRA